MKTTVRTGHRRLVVLRGQLSQTRETAQALVATLDRVLWVGPEHATRRDVRKLLGSSFDAVVVEMHGGLDADVLGQCHGFVVGDGALIISAPVAAPAHPGLAAWGYDVSQVGDRMWRRVFDVFAAFDQGPQPVDPPHFVPRGTDDQARLVRSIGQLVRGDDQPVIVLTADRGRGKSAGLGLMIAELGGEVVVTAPDREAAAEIFEFAGTSNVRYVEPATLLDERPETKLVIVDEAAQLPVALLTELTWRYARTPIVFSTTTHGYEGTGRGFLLRFVEQLRCSDRPLVEVEMSTPIRWSPEDPVERAVFDALLLDAEPADPRDLPVTTRQITQDELAGDERLLREVFGLLVQAHYRTTPGDLHRLLDAPNLSVHACSAGGHVVAATVVAAEGGLDAETAAALSDGALRINGHALPDTFAAHLGYPAAAQMRMVRSVRIATHPNARRGGIATMLVEHIHEHYDVDLFGTVFGATPDLIAFRRTVGYEVVRLSASRGAGTGVPSVVMLRAVSDEAREFVARLRSDLARDLPSQLALFRADGVVRLDPALEDALLANLPEPGPLDPEIRDSIVRHYAFGPRTFESAAVPLHAFLQSADLSVLDESLRLVVEHRALGGQAWTRTADAASLSVPAAMRALRRAVRTLIDSHASR